MKTSSDWLNLFDLKKNQKGHGSLSTQGVGTVSSIDKNL